MYDDSDKLIKTGSYFSQAISASDGTLVSLGSILTGQHPFNHHISTFENHSNAKINFNELKRYGYFLYALENSCQHICRRWMLCPI